MSKPNNAGMVSFDVCNINALYLEGQRFQNLDQAEMDLIIANLDAIVSNATKITALEAADVVINTAISALQTTDISQNTAITNLQTSDSAQNNKIQYWNADGTVYNNGGNEATEIYANPLQIGDTDVGNFIKLGVEGDVGIRLESVNHELVEVAPTIIIRAQDTTNHNEHIDIGLGYGNVAENGKTEVNIGSGQSTVNICAKQSSSSIADGAKIYIGVKQNVDADSDIYIRGNFHSEDCQMVTLDVTNSITWGTLIAQAAFIPFMPGLILSSIFGPTVQFSYSDLIHLTSSKFMESTNSPNLNGISVFDSSITSTVFPAINFLSLFGSITNWTGAGNIELTALAGEVLQKVGDNSTSTYNYTKVKTNGIDIYSKADTINLISNGNGMVKILHGSDLLLHNTSDGNGKYIHIKDKLKITNGTFSPPYTTEITDALVASYASLFTVGNIATVNSTKLTFDNVNASTTTNSLYRDANSNLFWNGRNISNYTAGTASTYILSISANITSPPASNGTLNLTYTSTPLYYINYTGYATSTELEVGTFTSANVDLIANPFISAGLWSFNYHTTVTANVEVRSYFKVYIQETVTATNTSTTTLLKDGSSNYVILTPNGTLGTYALTYNELFIDYYQFPNLTTCTYKVIIKAYIYQPSGTTSHNVRFGFNDTALSHVHTTFQNVSATSTLQNVLLAGNTAGSTPINMNGQAIQNASDILPQSNNDLVVGSKASSTGKTYIYANAQPRITVSNSGNVGVGSDNTSPAYLLDASGGAVNCSELRINGVVQTFGGSQTLAQTLTQGNTANTSINMNGNNITGANEITGNNLTFKTGGVDRLKLTDAGIYFNNTLYHGLTYQMGFNRIIYDGQIPRTTNPDLSPWTFNYFLASMPGPVDLTYYDIEYYLSVRRGGGGNLNTNTQLNYACGHFINQDLQKNNYAYMVNITSPGASSYAVACPFSSSSDQFYLFYYGNNTYWEAQVEGHIAMANRFPITGTNKTFTHNINTSMNVYSAIGFSGSTMTYKLVSQGLSTYTSTTNNFSSIAFWAPCNSFIEQDSMYLTVKQVQRRNI
jgi:hypothetical protein